MTDDAQPFSEVGIVGLGLIGGSIALAARATWPSVRLVGCDQSPSAADRARGRIVDRTVERVADFDGCDLVVLAVPLSAMRDVMPALAAFRRTPVVTDVGSTKQHVMRAAADAGLRRFVGGHPMAGSERGGLDEARRELFVGRPWLLIASDRAADDARRVERFVAGLGARPHWTDADAHDRAMAYVSHLPQLVSVALMNAAAASLDSEGLSAGGRAFDEMTRLASSPPDLWQEIVSENATFIREALATFIRELPAGDDLSSSRWVRESFGRASTARAGARERTPHRH